MKGLEQPTTFPAKNLATCGFWLLTTRVGLDVMIDSRHAGLQVPVVAQLVLSPRVRVAFSPPDVEVN